MLAYLFWHWPAEPTERASYDTALAAFHEALRCTAPPGFLRSAAFAVDPAPFDVLHEVSSDPGGGPWYEDWYLLADSAALDTLAAAAVGEACGPAHVGVARLAGGGTAGLYRLVAGRAELTSATGEWLDVSTDRQRQAAVDELEATAGSSRGSLWMRYMTLGPAPELCFLSPAGSTGAGGPAPGHALRQRRTLVWGAFT